MTALATVVALRPGDGTSTEEVVERFGRTLTNDATRRNYTRSVRQALRETGASRPADLDESDLIAWCCAARANNSVRTRIGCLLNFIAWCHAEGIACFVPTEHRWVQAKRQHPKTYGKVQGHHPPRWLRKEQAYDALCGACRDGTATAVRDEIVIRLGLAGVRVTEIGRLVIGDVDLDRPVVTWIGKGNKPRKITPGETLVDLLRLYLAEYEAAVGELRPDMPLICRERRGTRNRGTLRLDWGHGFAVPANSLHSLIARRAGMAGLGHVAPHDLRRTTAGILHRARTPEGAHYFDLLDIQQVLDHADPTTTMRSYLEPLNTEVKDRAARFLD